MEISKSLKKKGGRVAYKNIPVAEGFFNVDKEMVFYRADKSHSEFAKKHLRPVMRLKGGIYKPEEQ